MRKSTRSPLIKLISSLALVLMPLVGIIIFDRYTNIAAAATTAPSSRKISDDLRQKVRGAKDGERVDVIIQPAGSWNQSLDSALANLGGSTSRLFNNFNFRGVKLPAAAIEALATRPDIAQVSLDREVKLLGHLSVTTGADAARAMGSPAYLGTGVGIAVLDSGIFAEHVAFRSDPTRVAYTKDFTGELNALGQPVTADNYGHGTHVASIAAGNGAVAQNAYLGMAPAAKIINLRVLNSQGKGSVSALISALDWLMVHHSTYNVRVVNMSLGTAAVESYKTDPLCLAVRRLVDAGLVVVAAAGNEGKDSLGNKVYGQIHSPGNDPSVITVGASNSLGTNFRGDDVMTSYSSRGPTRSYWTDELGVKHYDNLLKPDMVAPGNKIIDAQAPNNQLVRENPLLDTNVAGSMYKEQMYLSGTSMATPIVSGAAALLLQANPSLTPNLVKTILMYTAQPLAGYNHFEQGAGQINIEGAMRLAKAIRTDVSTANLPLGAPLLCATCSVPAPNSTIDGFFFQWSGGVILDHTFATGENLITQYQKIYDLGVLLGDATKEITVLGSGVLMGDGVMVGDGVLLADHILTITGDTIGEGTIFKAVGVLVGDGVLLADGVMLGDGVLVGDGVLISDGVLVGDLSAEAGKAMVLGDDTPSMPLVKDITVIGPNNLSANASSTSQINLSWTDNADKEDGFIVERCQGAGCTNFAQIAQLGANVTSYINTGLTVSTPYVYRVYAFDNQDNSNYSNTVSVSTLAPPAPAVPTSLDFTVYSTTQVNLSWMDNSTDETGFRVERCAGVGCTNFVQIAQLGANIKAYSNTGLAVNTTYVYRVRAYNNNGNSAYSSAVQVAMQAPPAPSALSGLAASTTQINVSWADNSNNEDGFDIERCTGATCTKFTKITQAGKNLTSYSNTGLTTRTTYRYRVRAVNKIGTSTYSTIVTVTTK
ncbi:MAG TPA: S8 family serine peptidase [Pyrinomonadaceae bacterium]